MNLKTTLTRPRSVPRILVILSLFAAGCFFLWEALGPSDPLSVPALSREHAQEQLEQIRIMQAKLEAATTTADADPKLREQAQQEFRAELDRMTRLREQQEAVRKQQIPNARFRSGLWAAFCFLYAAYVLYTFLKAKARPNPDPPSTPSLPRS